MFAQVKGAHVQGFIGKIINVEIDVSPGLPQCYLVGLPDAAVRESINRVRAAIRNSGFNFPMKRVTINLSPADERKRGTSFDLAIAAAILQAHNQLSILPHQALWLGELSLDGRLHPIQGVLSMIDQAISSGIKQVFLPKQNATEASLLSGIKIYSLEHLNQLFEWPKHIQTLVPLPSALPLSVPSQNQECTLDFKDIIGQTNAKRAAIIAATGHHPIIAVGPPGTGKTMLMRRLPSILPPMTRPDSIILSKIYSAIGLFKPENGLMNTRPFRNPHSSISLGGMFGGGANAVPGELMKAHTGVLFLDEVSEFSREVLEQLRQPLEDGFLQISRARAQHKYPCRVLLALAMNPCPCGRGDFLEPFESCQCSPHQKQRYAAKISKSLLDRIDLRIDMIPELLQDSKTIHHTTSEEMSLSVQQAVEFRNHRLADIQQDILFHDWSPAAKKLLNQAMQVYQLSQRANERLRRVSRTIADLDCSHFVHEEHAAEAIQYRHDPKRER